MQEQLPSSHQDSAHGDVIDLRFLVGLLKANKWFIILVTFVCVLLGGTYAAISPPVYESSALIKVNSSSGNASNITALLGIMGGGDGGSRFMDASPAEIETSLIQSDYIMGTVVETLKLNISATPKHFPIVGSLVAKFFPSLSEKDESIEVPTFTIPKTLEGEKFYLEVKNNAGDYVLSDSDNNTVLKGKLGQLNTSEKKGISLEVNILNAKPGSVFTIVKKPTNKFVKTLLNDVSIKEQGDKTGILEISYKSKDPETAQKILNTILKVAVEKNIAEKAEEATKTLSFLKDQLPAVTQDLDTAENRLNKYRAKTGSVDSAVEAEILLQQIVSIEKDINELNLKKLEMLEDFTSKHPYIVAMDQKEEQLEKQLANVEAQLRKIPLTSQEAINLERDIKVHGEIYSGIMQNMQQMQMLQGSTVSSVRILDAASFPVLPVSSKMPLILLVSFILGVSLSTAFLLFRYALSHTLDPLVLEKALNLQVLTIIPYSASQTKLFKEMRNKKVVRENYLLTSIHPKDVSIEALRSLRTSLKLVSLSQDKKIISISGCSPNVGKSFVSSNLVSLLADLGEKVLLIDADMRKGYLHKVFSCAQPFGLSEYLQGSASLEQCTKKILTNVDIITTGSYPSNPAELLMHHRLGDLIESVKELYDIILIDTPPVLAVTDASLIFKIADIKLLIVGSGKDQLKEIERTKGVLEKSGILLDGIIYNNLHHTEKKYGYSGYYNYYNYSYRYE